MIYANLEVFVREDVLGSKKDEEEEEDIDSDTDGDGREVEERTEKEESEEEEVDDGDEEGSEEEERDNDERDEDKNEGVEPFWGFVLKARDFVDEDMEDRLDKYVRKETKRILKEKEEEEMEMDMDDEDHPQNSGEMIRDVLDIVDDFEQSGPCCIKTCSR